MEKCVQTTFEIKQIIFTFNIAQFLYEIVMSTDKICLIFVLKNTWIKILN